MTTPENHGGPAAPDGRGEAVSARSGASARQMSGGSKPGASRSGLRPEWRYSLPLFILGASWGLQFTLLKIAGDSDLNELAILTIAMFLLACAYLVVMACKVIWFRPSLSHLWFFLISAFFGFVVPLGAVILVAEQLSAGLIVFFESLTPVLTVVIVLLVGTERLNAPRLASVTLGMIGVLLVLWPDLTSPGSARMESLLLALIIPLAYAIDGVYVAARWPSDLDAFQVVTGEAIAATVMLLPFFLWQSFSSFEAMAALAAPWLHAPWGWGQWAVLAFVPVSFLEVYLYFYLLKQAGAVFVSIGSFIALFGGIFWGMLLLGERHSATVWIAVLLVSCALYLANFRATRPGEAKTEPAVVRVSD
ncbi:DMT family transporter [Denitrobaculum tricleocarpae]|uniref:DMT family transporter n=1 Tax=Denitrobaculum tricleocarpae TaxID=2591009 RepID=A0A545TKW1_9PROT|nr:DMT family transporter [Denitrobaculum tricleocarpae]TQV77801.1 DMT family transporter [Denitrobaculum tricleocarpae]